MKDKQVHRGALPLVNCEVAEKIHLISEHYIYYAKYYGGGERGGITGVKNEKGKKRRKKMYKNGVKAFLCYKLRPPAATLFTRG